MLLIDGVKYELWTPPSEDEFEQVVKEHAQEIFGEQSIYFDRKQKLKSLSGIGSIPDGYVIVFRDSPEWHIVEVELSSHPLYEHIVTQVSRFISGIGNPNIQRGIVNAIDGEITKDDFLKLKLKKAIEPTEIYRFLADLISKPPILTIIIEKASLELREALRILRYPQEIKVVEFQTFTREGVGLSVHAHLFEPVCKPTVRIEPPKVVRPLVPETQKLEHTLTQRDLKMKRFRIPKRDKGFFPPPYVDFELMTDVGIVKTNGRGRGDPLFIQRNLREWFRKHHDLKVGNKVTFTVTEPMKKYRLELLEE